MVKSSPSRNRISRLGWFSIGVVGLGTLVVYLRREALLSDQAGDPASGATLGSPSEPVPSSKIPGGAAVSPTLKIPVRVLNPTYSQLRFLDDPAVALAIGSEGHVLRSTDDGRTWTSIETGTREFLLDSCVLPRSKTTIVVGSHGTVLRSADAGATFEKVSVPTERAFRAVAASEAKPHVLAVGDDGMAFYSTDGGSSYSAEVTGTANYLAHIVAVPGKERFIIAGDLGTILIRDELGKYRPSRSPAQMSITAIAVMPDGTLVAGSQDGFVLRSSDAGETFVEAHKMREDRFVIGFDWDPSGSVLLGRLRTREILVSRDRGGSFTELAFQPKQGLSKLVWHEGHGFAGLGLQGAIVTSDLDANHWSIRPAPNLPDPTFVAAHPATRSIIAVGASGLVARSTNHGKTFDVVRPSLGGLLRAMAWDEARGCIVATGFQATILRSEDGGKNWVPAPASADTGAELNSAVFDSRHGAFVAAGSDGSVVRSTDCGRNWSRVRAPTKKAIHQLLALKEGVLLAMSADPAVLRSTDGGATFDAVEMDADATLRRAVAVGAGDVVVAIGNDGRIYRSSDAGRRWQRVPSGTSAHLRAAAYDAATQSTWIVGDAGSVLVSQDAGGSWSLVRVPTAENLFVVAVEPNNHSIWIGGNRGAVLRAADRDAEFTPLDSGSTQTIRTIVWDPTTNESYIAGSGGTLLRTVEGKRLARVAGAFDGRIDVGFFHAPTGAILLGGDRLYRIDGN